MNSILLLGILFVSTPVLSTPGVHDVREYGALGDGQTLDTGALQAAIDACAEQGGGTILVPPGTYLTGSLFLRSNQTLILSAGATLLASTDWYRFPVVRGRFEGIDRDCFASLISCREVENVAIEGRGTLNGQGEEAGWWSPYKVRRDRWGEYQKKGIITPPPGEEAAFEWARLGGIARPRMVEFYKCRNVRLEGITIRNSPSWTIHPIYSDNVVIDGVTVINPAHSHNTDGCNPDSSRNVRISNCFFDVGDDCIAIKSGRDEEGRKAGRATENVSITNCTMLKGHGGVVIGSEMSGGVRNLSISNCAFQGTDVGIRLKTKRGRGGVVEDITVSNIAMRAVPVPIRINMHYQPTDPEPVSDRTPIFRNVHFQNIVATGADEAIVIRGLEEMPVEDVTFSNLRINASRGASVLDADKISLHNVQINVVKGSALGCERVKNLVLNAFVSRTPQEGVPLIDFENVDHAFLTACTAPDGTGLFLRAEGGRSREILLRANDLRGAERVFVLGDGVEEGTVRVD